MCFIGCSEVDYISQYRNVSNSVDNPFRNSKRALHFDSLSRAEQSEEKKFQYEFQAAIEFLRAGDSREAISRLTTLEEQVKSSAAMDETSRTAGLGLLARYKALSYLRLGEQENCIDHHGSASCILPIGPEGTHHLPEGSKNAISLYSAMVEADSLDLNARWLYSIASMTLGQSTAPYGFQDSLFFKNKPELKFQDIAMHKGLDIVGLSGGSVIDDFNGDGLLDVMASSWGPQDQVRLLIQQEGGEFEDVTNEAGLNGVMGGLNMMQTDYNNDGRPDILILRGAWMGALGRIPNTLLKNLGEGKFEDVTVESNLHSAMPTQTAIWRDFDNDGFLDLFIGNETTNPASPHPCELYMNNGNGGFDLFNVESGLTIFAYVKGVASSDFDKNGYPDLFISTLFGKDQLWMNQGPAEGARVQFVESSEAAGITGNYSSFPTWAFDYNHDGWTDIYVSGLQIGERHDALKDVVLDFNGMEPGADKARLWQNNGDGTFTNVAESAGLDHVMLAMGSNFGDFNNDGWLDIYLGTGEPSLEVIVPNRAFVNREGSFEEITFGSGLGHIQKGHGVSFADLDRDGDQDIYMVVGGAYEGDFYANALFENQYSGKNHSVILSLEGVKSNHPGIGTRITFFLADGSRRYFEVSSGGSFGASPLDVHFGVGPFDMVSGMEVYWPSGIVQTFKDIPANSHLFVREGDQIEITPI